MAEGLLNYTRLDDPDEVVCTTQGRPMCPDDEVRLVDELDQRRARRRARLAAHPRPLHAARLLPAAEQNARAFTADGWYRTGDICRRTPEGNLIVEGRDKDMINRGGEKISAEEVENLVYQLPDGQPGRRRRHARPGARRAGLPLRRAAARARAVTLEEIRELRWSARGVARFKLPEHLVLVDELAATKVGKIDKKALRADIADRLGGGGASA